MSGIELAIPPLRQSTYEQMACPHSYGLIFIDGVTYPDSDPSMRGTELHQILAHYIEHCAKKRVPADFLHIDELAESCGDESAMILTTCRDNLTVDWQNLFGVELSMGLDEEFHPTDSVNHKGEKLRLDPRWNIFGTGDATAYSGVLDAVYLMPGGKAARIVDMKSHPRPFEPTTFQAKLYTLFLFMHMPELREIEFVLKFIRYSNLNRPITFHREQVPDLMADVRRHRERQKEYHRAKAAGDELIAIGSNACTYCPCNLQPEAHPCPIADLNPAINRTPGEWLSFKMAIDAMKRVADKTLQQLADNAAEPIKSQDANGKWYVYEPKEVEVITTPLFSDNGDGGFDMPIVDALIKWAETNPADLVPRKGSKPWFCNLKIGWTKLHSYLKANKRELIHNRIRDLATITKAVRYSITRDAELDDGPAESGWDAAGDDDLEF
jgi:hypothetical protein